MARPRANAGRDKKTARRRLRQRRAHIAPNLRRERAPVMLRHFLRLPLPAGPARYMVYVAAGDEAPTEGLARYLLERGHTVCVPRLDANRRGEMDVVPIARWDELVPGPFFNIPQPAPDVAPVPKETLDVIVVPGVGFDAQGRRLGQGGGYYDRFLVGLPARVLRVGWAFSEQIAAKLPAEPHDQGVSFVVTEKGITDCRGGGKAQ